ncbi:MAG: hybrid sensor histidine kinase/response regulator [Rubrivivax sp.]|nr:MAG: hybrid sensor histidine kinase/response regulator [Rubrivivax sp.]
MRIWREQITPLRDETGAITRLSIVAEEITEQRRAEDALRRSREELQHLAQLLQLAFDGIFVWTAASGIEFWNRGAELQYGYTAAEALGQHPGVLLKTVFPDGESQTDEALQRDGVWRGELSHETKYGRRIAATAVIQRVGNGEDRMMEITRDISEAKAYEARLLDRERDLQQSQQRLQIALDAGRMGVWTWAPAQKQSFWSPEIYRLLGLPADAPADAVTFLALVHPDDRPALEARLREAMERGGDYEAEFRVARPGGEIRWLISRGRAIHGAAGSGLVGVNFDITERKLNEQALHDADARRTEFLAMLAHELRNPLAPITNAVRLLEKAGDVPQKRDAAIAILQRQTAHMTRLVDDLLEGSRITQGRIELRMENLLVATSVFQAVEAARPLARDRGQSITVKVPHDLDLMADPARLTQIVSNLVTNAVKYTQPGGRVVVMVTADDDDKVSIAVQDDGPGISPALQPHLFGLFAQDRRTLDRSQGGLGIGLALVKRLAELHGGHVRHEVPKSGVGARFIVCLPRHRSEDERRARPGAAHAPALQPLHILVVDDNADAAVTLASLLEMDGHRVELAHDGAQALATAQRSRPAVVLLDIGLPTVDGLEVARQLRADERFPDVILIATSGYAQAADREASAAAGFDAHLPKPVDLETLYAAIESRLNG